MIIIGAAQLLVTVLGLWLAYVSFDLRGKNDLLRRQNNILQGRNDSLQANISILGVERTQLKDSVEELKRQLVQLGSSLQSTKIDLQQTSVELGRTREQLSNAPFTSLLQDFKELGADIKSTSPVTQQIIRKIKQHRKDRPDYLSTIRNMLQDTTARVLQLGARPQQNPTDVLSHYQRTGVLYYTIYSCTGDTLDRNNLLSYFGQAMRQRYSRNYNLSMQHKLLDIFTGDVDWSTDDRKLISLILLELVDPSQFAGPYIDTRERLLTDHVMEVIRVLTDNRQLHLWRDNRVSFLNTVKICRDIALDEKVLVAERELMFSVLKNMAPRAFIVLAGHVLSDSTEKLPSDSKYEEYNELRLQSFRDVIDLKKTIDLYFPENPYWPDWRRWLLQVSEVDNLWMEKDLRIFRDGPAKLEWALEQYRIDH